MVEPEQRLSEAKSYQKKKQRLMLFHLALTLAVLAFAILAPVSVSFAKMSYRFTENPYGALAVYFFLFSMFFLIVDLPYSFYSGYIVEHQFHLSNQTLSAWLKDFLKKSSLSFAFSLLLIEFLYALVWKFPDRWWLLAWAGYAFVSYVIGKIFPVCIVPLFYKYSQVGDEGLKKRILDLAARYGMPVENVYSLNLSKTTKKANAAFMGIGKTKRVVLSDTLLENFDGDEIETVVAHELGHFKHHDIWKQLAFGLVTSFVSFWIAWKLLGPAAQSFGFVGAGDIAALPLLFLIFYIFGLVLLPLQNGYSRLIERAADQFALDAFPNLKAFVSCMEKLATVNLADPEPNPVIEWFFYDHPAIGKRIKMAKSYMKAPA